jgi:homocitrate synthase
MNTSNHNKISKNFKGIVDSTLREGMQFRNAEFTIEQSIQIFQYLNQIGVDYIELGNPLVKEYADLLKAISNLKSGKRSKVLLHIRNNKRDLEASFTCNVCGVNILCTADSERVGKLGITFKKYIKNLEENIRAAQSEGFEVRVSVEDMFNQPENLVYQIYQVAESLDVERIGMADTLGRSTYWEINSKVSQIRKEIRKTGIEVHFHNDLGNAVSNSLAALCVGANYVDTTLLGIGERVGIVSLSNLLINLEKIDSSLTQKYNLKYLTEAENHIANICNIETPFNMLTNRRFAFSHKAGIHLDALIKFGPQKYEPIAPALIGNQRELVVDSCISGKTKTDQVNLFYKNYGRS